MIRICLITFVFLLSAPLARAVACEDGHWIADVLADGEILKLEDGSMWKVDPTDTVDSALWLAPSDVVVCDFTIVNVDEGETVHVRPLR